MVAEVGSCCAGAPMIRIPFVDSLGERLCEPERVSGLISTEMYRPNCNVRWREPYETLTVMSKRSTLVAEFSPPLRGIDQRYTVKERSNEDRRLDSLASGTQSLVFDGTEPCGDYRVPSTCSCINCKLSHHNPWQSLLRRNMLVSLHPAISRRAMAGILTDMYDGNALENH